MLIINTNHQSKTYKPTKEAKYYLIQEMVVCVEEMLKSKTELEPICRVPLITSLKEEQALIASTDKVFSIVSLLIYKNIIYIQKCIISVKILIIFVYKNNF